MGKSAGKDGIRKIGKVLQYGAISVMVQDAEICQSFENTKSQPGGALLVVGLRLENTKSQSCAYIVPDEEIWISHKEGELSKPENYRFQTALDKGKPTEGHAWFNVPAGAKKFSLFFGKKTLPKMCVDFEI